jgi:ribosomal protein S27AE
VAEQIKIVKLNCANCGGVLEIHEDMDQFACGYCGSAQIVERRGGTVALKLVVDAVARVQVGTDRTAAELALIRLEKELASAHAQWQAAGAKFNQSNNPSSPPAIIGMVLASVVGVLGLLILGANLDASAKGPDVGSLVLSVVLLGGAIAAFIFCLRQNAEAGKRHAAKRLEFEAPYEQRIQELEQSIKKNREMVDDS